MILFFLFVLTDSCPRDPRKQDKDLGVLFETRWEKVVERDDPE